MPHLAGIGQTIDEYFACPYHVLKRGRQVVTAVSAIRPCATLYLLYDLAIADAFRRPPLAAGRAP